MRVLKTLVPAALALGAAAALSACGTTTEERAATGAIGGAVAGGVIGGDVAGAAVGGVAGAAVGAATTPDHHRDHD